MRVHIDVQEVCRICKLFIKQRVFYMISGMRKISTNFSSNTNTAQSHIIHP